MKMEVAPFEVDAERLLGANMWLVLLVGVLLLVVGALGFANRLALGGMVLFGGLFDI